MQVPPPPPPQTGPAYPPPQRKQKVNLTAPIVFGICGLAMCCGLVDLARQAADPKYRAEVEARRAAEEKRVAERDLVRASIIEEERRKRSAEEAAKLAAEEKQKKLLAQELVVYGPKPEVSRRDGLAKPAHTYLKRTLNDPDSLKVGEVTDVLKLAKKKCWTQYAVIRAKNGFGAMTRQEVVFYIKNDEVIDVEGM